jgi:hypothetical protein
LKFLEVFVDALQKQNEHIDFLLKAFNTLGDRFETLFKFLLNVSSRVARLYQVSNQLSDFHASSELNASIYFALIIPSILRGKLFLFVLRSRLFRGIQCFHTNAAGDWGFGQRYSQSKYTPKSFGLDLGGVHSGAQVNGSLAFLTAYSQSSTHAIYRDGGRIDARHFHAYYRVRFFGVGGVGENSYRNLSALPCFGLGENKVFGKDV